MRKSIRINKFKIYKDKAGQYRWRLVSLNGRIIAQGESHKRKYNAIRSAKVVKNAAFFSIIEA